MNAANTIKAARKHLGMTQAEYATLTGHVQATISKWESGQWTPDRYDLALAERLAQSSHKRARAVLISHGPIYCLGSVLRL